MNDAIFIRFGNPKDAQALRTLYQEVSAASGKLARTPEELTETFVSWVTQEALKNGIWLVAEIEDKIAASILAHRPEPASLNHVLNYLTIAVHPAFQRQGLGRKIFSRFIQIVEDKRPEISRIELFVRESNHHAIRLYESLGFEIEGKFTNRIRRRDGSIESDIPMGWLRREFHS